MREPNLFIPVGIPGCGKSTWAETFLPDVVVISTDAIRERMGDINDQSRNGEVFQRFHQGIRVHLAHDNDVVADATNLDARARRELVEIAKEQKAKVHLVYFSNCDQAVIRNAARLERIVPHDVMTRMLDKYEIFKLVLASESPAYDTITEIRSFS